VDDGKGFEWFPPGEQDFSQGGYGLFSIHERVSYMGGRMTVTSSANQGTRVVLRVPLGDSRQGAEDASRTESSS
jgi:signal transduction histidine kinase